MQIVLLVSTLVGLPALPALTIEHIHLVAPVFWGWWTADGRPLTTIESACGEVRPHPFGGCMGSLTIELECALVMLPPLLISLLLSAGEVGILDHIEKEMDYVRRMLR
jgi:hypothetical protein